MTKGFWVLTRYQDVFDVSRDTDRFSSFDEGFVIWDLEEGELALHRANLMGMQPADHTAVKQVVMPAFAPKVMNAMAPEIDRLARELVDEVINRGQCEFVFDVASKLPVYTFCELMGIPESMRARVVDLGNAMADVETRGQHTLDPTFQLFAIAEEISEMKRQQPDGSLMSLLVHDKTLGLSQININMFFIVFAVAGHETTRSTAAHFMHMMKAHPTSIGCCAAMWTSISRMPSRRFCGLPPRRPISGARRPWIPKLAVMPSRRVTRSTCRTPQPITTQPCSRRRMPSTSHAQMPASICPSEPARMCASAPAWRECSFTRF